MLEHKQWLQKLPGDGQKERKKAPEGPTAEPHRTVNHAKNSSNSPSMKKYTQVHKKCVFGGRLWTGWELMGAGSPEPLLPALPNCISLLQETFLGLFRKYTHGLSLPSWSRRKSLLGNNCVCTAIPDSCASSAHWFSLTISPHQHARWICCISLQQFPHPNQFLCNKDTECIKTKQKLNINTNAFLSYIFPRCTVLYSLCRGKIQKTKHHPQNPLVTKY